LKNNKSLYRLFAATFLLSVFMLPLVLNLHKVFDNHKHEVCEDTSTHFHEKLDSCFSCSDFNVSVFKPNPFLKIKFENNFFSKNQSNTYLFNFSSNKNKSLFLRGPPSIV
tara:strand:+ start:15 stop:344 length:330 start_codon:yes stop_codon:yes gene_type:complete